MIVELQELPGNSPLAEDEVGNKPPASLFILGFLQSVPQVVIKEFAHRTSGSLLYP